MAQASLPNMDEVNLGFLKRRDPDAEQILGSSAHVTMYIMSVESQKWERRNVEGTLYVVKRRTNPRFQMVVLNKLSTENYVETIETGFHAEVSPPYLIYTQGGGKVHGVWFYEEADLNKIANLLSKVESGLPKAPIPPPQTQAVVPSTAAPAADDGAFWDKPVHPNAPHTAPLAEQVSPAPPSGNALSNLFKNMQVKQQQQAPVQRHESMGPPVSAAPLPPAFFQQQSQQQPVNKNLDHLRTAAVLSPAMSADMAGSSFTSRDGAGDNLLNKLFTKPPVAPPSAAAPSAPTSGIPNALAALFSNASNKSGAHGSSSQLPVAPAPGVAVVTAPTLPQQTGGRPAVDERLRAALSRLVARDEFLVLLSEELRAVGLLGN